MKYCRCITGEAWRCTKCQAAYCLAILVALRVPVAPKGDKKR